MTLQDLRTRVRDNLAETDAAGRFSDAELLRYLNDGQLEIAKRTEALQKDVTASVAALQAAVSLPSDSLGVKRAQWKGADGTLRRLLETTEEYLDTVNSDNAAWIEETGTPTHYFTNGPDAIRLWRIPDAVGTLRIRYAYFPADLVNAGDESGLPRFLETPLPAYATWRAYASDRRFQQEAAFWVGAFEKQMDEGLRELWKRQSVPEATRLLLPVDPRRSVRRR